MALPEESEIMAEIGFGQHYNWFNGSGSCREIRIAAAQALPAALRAHGLPRDRDLLDLVVRVARSGEASDYVLDRTWVCASEVIALAIHQKAGMTADQLVKVRRAIHENFKPRPRLGGYNRIVMSDEEYGDRARYGG